MKKLLHVLGTIGFVLALTGCGEKPSEPTAPTSAEAATEAVESSAAGDVNLRFSWWGGDSRHQATLAAVNAFMEENPSIHVESEYGAWDGWTSKIATQLMSNTAPDLMQGNSNWLYQYSGDGSKFVDLNDYADIISLNEYPQEILDACTVAGKLQGLPIGTNTKCFWWNKASFDKAGTAIPTSWDELFTAAKAFEETLGPDYYPFAMDPYERMMLMLYYLQCKYQKPWAVDNQLNYTVPELTEGLDFLNRLEDEHVIPTLETLLGDGAETLDKNPNWIDGHYAGIYEWDGTIPKYAGALNDEQELVFGEYLVDDGMEVAGTTKITQVFCITTSSKHPREAAQLMNFLLDDPKGVKLMSTERGILLNEHANQTLRDAGLLKGYAADNHEAIAAAGKYSLDPNFENSALKDSTGIYREVLEELSAGGNPSALAQYLYDECNRVYAENPLN